MSETLKQHITELAVELLGPSGMLKPDGYPMARPDSPAQWLNAQQAFLRAHANAIEGGTTEIAKNILAERVLGLPANLAPTRTLHGSESLGTDPSRQGVAGGAGRRGPHPHQNGRVGAFFGSSGHGLDLLGKGLPEHVDGAVSGVAEHPGATEEPECRQLMDAGAGLA